MRGSSETLKLWLARGDTSSGARTPPLLPPLDEDVAPATSSSSSGGVVVPFVDLKSSLGAWRVCMCVCVLMANNRRAVTLVRVALLGRIAARAPVHAAAAVASAQ